VSSTIVITYDGNDITDSVILSSARFESLLSATPGTCEFTCKDPFRLLSFVTGKELTLSVDGTTMWGGYLQQVSRTHAFDADDTTPISSYENRYWTLRGVDYNILFDKRVLRRTANYLSRIPSVAGTTMDGAVLEDALANYIDVPAGFDTTTFIDNVAAVNEHDTSKQWAYPAQGEKLRVLFEELSKFRGQIYYIDGDKNFHFHALERAESRWGFSDIPNNGSINTSTSSFQNASYGFREVEATEDGSVIINDALVWGGSAFAGAGSTVFHRTQDSTSQTDHGRWQVGETHFGEEGFGIQAGVNARADAIVNGPPGTDAYGQQKGLRYPQWTFRFTWFAHDVPKISGVSQHLRAGMLTVIEMNVFSVTKVLPLRRLGISFPSGKSDGTTYVEFQGDFGIQTDDPFTLWAYLLKAEQRARLNQAVFSTVDDSSDSAVYGAIGNFVPTPTPDSSTTLFTIAFGYIAGTLQVYKNGTLQTSGVTQTDPEAGTFTLSPAPATGTTLFVVCRTLAC